MKNRIQSALLVLLALFMACESGIEHLEEEIDTGKTDPHLLVLGVAQDAGYPQAGCQKSCCQAIWEGNVSRKSVSCLALVDPKQKQAWMFDATPDFKWQLQTLQKQGLELAGIFLTHAHIGHYTGIMQLGHEAMGAQDIPVFVMPRMKDYLEKNGPWSQLVNYKNISLKPLAADSTIHLPGEFQVTPFLVPHRDEYSETVGYSIGYSDKRAIFIPDIDKWEKWDRDIVAEVQKADYAFLDATFYANGEIPGRDMSEIPHPFIEESMNKFAQLPDQEKKKVHFIHFNHTNPVLRTDSEAYRTVLQNGYQVAQEGMIR